MAFVNELISKGDIKKYKIDQDYLRDHPECESLPNGFAPQWTIDRERNMFLMLSGRARQNIVDESWTEFSLYREGIKFSLRLEYGPGRSSKYIEKPYVIVWNLLAVYPNDCHGFPKEQILELFKEALTAYGEDGVRSFVPDVVVKFNF